MSEELKGMQVNIAGRSYPIRVKEEDRESIRQIVDEINEKVKDFQLTYIHKDKQDCMAMALLTYAVDYHREKKAGTPSELLDEKVNRLESMIDDILK